MPAVEAARLTVSPESAATTRHEVVAALAEAVMSLPVGHPIRVGVDGWSNAGKTTLADELAVAIQAAGRQSLRASIDDFHRKGHKYRSLRGEWTPQLYFEEGYDYAVFRAWVLDPLGPGGSALSPDGSRRCRTEMLDAYTDVLLPEVWHDVADDAVMIVDGIFLSHPDLASHWEYLIWLDVDVETMIQRSLVRDGAVVGSAEAVEQRYRRFRQPVYEHYERLASPATRAHAVMDNRDLEHPTLVRLTQP